MATGEQPSPLKSKKISSSSIRSRNDSDSQWLLLPNNLELGARAKPSKKQRNKEKHRQFQKENLSSSDVADALSCKTDSFHNYPQVKCNTATWLKDQFMNDEKSKRRAYDSEEVFSDSDLQSHQQNLNLPSNQIFPDLDHQEHQPVSRCVVENDNIKSVKDELKNRETAIVCEILSHIQEFISEAESSWQKLDLSDEPVIKDAFLKLKNAVKDVEGDRENKLMLHHLTSENGFSNGVSSSSSASRVSNSKENIVNRDSVGNAVLCNDDEQAKCNHLLKPKVPDETVESLSSDDCSIADVGERVAAVEWERRKLKNKLVELQEEKKIKDELLRELCFLKNAANTASSSSQHLKTKDRKKKKLCKYQSSQQPKMVTNGVSSEDNQNMTQEPNSLPVSEIGPRHSRSSTSVKRDNVRKEQNSAFPARRHYEAEGRANEDPDIPAASAPVSSPALDNPEIHDKIRKLKVAQQHVKVIKDIVVSILESRKSGSIIPLEQLCLLAPLHRSDQYFSDESGEESEPDKELHSGALESTTNAKEICSDDLKTAFLDGDRRRDGRQSDKQIDGQNNSISYKTEDVKQVPGNLETVGKKGDLAKLQSQFQQLMQIFPSADRNNDDPVRSSGEGAYTQKKNPNNVIPENVKKIQSIRTVPHQDNLQLTRQNIVSVESQSQNSNSYLHNRDCNAVKKDNINNLSGKMGKLCIQNSMNSSYPDVLTGSNNNMDTISTLSYELNQNHSLPNEVERKTILDILKRDKKKQKSYDRNQDTKICCNSSVDSEPLEGSNSALAVDTAAAWGGSSTQENFEDENEEHAESLEQDDEEENASVFEKRSLRGQGSASQYSGQFSNMHHYIDSLTNIPDKRQRNLHHPLYNQNQNLPAMQSEYQQHSSQAMKSSRRRLSSPTTAGGISRDVHNTSHPVDTAEYSNQHPSPKFIQQLKNHVDQINALCQNQIFHDRSQQSVNCSQTQSYLLPNTCIPFQHGPEMALPSNQQMLLCLSQCYHALYMQQLEIQHLQRCMWHNLDSENVQHPNTLNTRANQEDSNYRPYSAPSWPNPFLPSNHFPPDISPMSSGYHHSPMKPYSAHSSGMYGSAHGTQPARAVIHPTSQNNMPSQETLNNQVPPRSRANNFWDNFRSYSRQNLLSTSNSNKRNENASSLVTPQVRQVYPLVANDSPNCTPDVSNAFCNTASFSECNRSATNPDILGTINLPKKTKANTPTSAATSSSSFHKKDVPTGIVYAGFQNTRSNKCYRLNMEPSVTQPVSSPPSVNLIQLQPVQETSKVGSCSSICLSSVHPAIPEVPVSSTASEISHSTDHQSDYLAGIFHEAQSLKSDVLRQKALKIIRDLAMSENHDSDDVTQVKIQNDQSLPTMKPESSLQTTIFSQSCTKQPIEGAISSEVHEIERTHVLTDNLTGNVQSLPTTAISPLSKHNTPRSVSTGAVRKKPKLLSTCFSDPISNEPAAHDSAGSTGDNSDPSPALVLPINKVTDDIPGLVTEKVLADLISMLPSLKRRLLRDGCSQSFWTFINDCLIESLRNHLFYCNISLSRKSLIHLRQTVYLFISLFSGITLPDFDTDFLKYVEEFIYENVTCFVASGQFAPVPPSLDEETCSLGIEDKTQELGLKMPLEQSNQMKELSIKMPSEESDNFSPHCRTVSQQNLLQSLCSFENFIPEPSNESDCAGPTAEDVGCGCNPEAEIEPEVEIGTEADLAEADQSPGQQNTVGENLPTTESWSADQETTLNRNTSAGGINLNSDDNQEMENSSEAAPGLQVFSDVCLDQEAILDDIPIKLCPSEEELPHQLKEQPVPLPSEDNSYSEYISENNGDGGASTLR